MILAKPQITIVLAAFGNLLLYNQINIFSYEMLEGEVPFKWRNKLYDIYYKIQDGFKKPALSEHGD